MTDFILKQLPYDLSGQAGLALIGKYLKLKRINFNALVVRPHSVRRTTCSNACACTATISGAS